jgi:hypothetical protein
MGLVIIGKLQGNTAGRATLEESRVPLGPAPPRSCFTGAKLSLPANGGFSETPAAKMHASGEVAAGGGGRAGRDAISTWSETARVDRCNPADADRLSRNAEAGEFTHALPISMDPHNPTSSR